jgi:hypothetical protein
MHFLLQSVCLVHVYCLDCIVSTHWDAKLPEVHRTIGAYLKMAPYRQGGAGRAGKGAAFELSSLNDDVE